MKKLVVLGTLTAVLFIGCKNPDSAKTAERMDAMEKRIDQLEKRAAPARAMPPEQTAAYQIPVGQSHVMGNRSAAVSVVIFSDFQCPFCARTEPLFADLMKDPSLKEKVNVVFKHFPLTFHQNARPASKAALAAGEQGKFWEMSSKLYENQTSLSDTNYEKWAKEIGLNVAKFKSDLKSNDAKYEEMIKADIELGDKVAHVRGTPSIFVGGWELRERSVDGIKNLIKEKKLL